MDASQEAVELPDCLVMRQKRTLTPNTLDGSRPFDVALDRHGKTHHLFEQPFVGIDLAENALRGKCRDVLLQEQP